MFGSERVSVEPSLQAAIRAGRRSSPRRPARPGSASSSPKVGGHRGRGPRPVQQEPGERRDRPGDVPDGVRPPPT
ncbi:hypothetical protein HBB16_17335 [Pseudonocardia sp. MCCB 268]|nr:hypothetical protein [Pseudonocardia cytotoxica]